MPLDSVRCANPFSSVQRLFLDACFGGKTEPVSVESESSSAVTTSGRLRFVGFESSHGCLKCVEVAQVWQEAIGRSKKRWRSAGCCLSELSRHCITWHPAFYRRVSLTWPPKLNSDGPLWNYKRNWISILALYHLEMSLLIFFVSWALQVLADPNPRPLFLSNNQLSFILPLHRSGNEAIFHVENASFVFDPSYMVMVIHIGSHSRLLLGSPAERRDPKGISQVPTCFRYSQRNISESGIQAFIDLCPAEEHPRPRPCFASPSNEPYYFTGLHPSHVCSGGFDWFWQRYNVLWFSINWHTPSRVGSGHRYRFRGPLGYGWLHILYQPSETVQ